MQKTSTDNDHPTSQSIIAKQFPKGFKNDYYFISKILKERTLLNGQIQLFVSWEGWPPQYNSWVYQDTVKPAHLVTNNETLNIDPNQSNDDIAKWITKDSSPKPNSILYQQIPPNHEHIFECDLKQNSKKKKKSLSKHKKQKEKNTSELLNEKGEIYEESDNDKLNYLENSSVSNKGKNEKKKYHKKKKKLKQQKLLKKQQQKWKKQIQQQQLFTFTSLLKAESKQVNNDNNNINKQNYNIGNQQITTIDDNKSIQKKTNNNQLVITVQDQTDIELSRISFSSDLLHSIDNDRKKKIVWPNSPKLSNELTKVTVMEDQIFGNKQILINQNNISEDKLNQLSNTLPKLNETNPSNVNPQKYPIQQNPQNNIQSINTKNILQMFHLTNEIKTNQQLFMQGIQETIYSQNQSKTIQENSDEKQPQSSIDKSNDNKTDIYQPRNKVVNPSIIVKYNQQLHNYYKIKYPQLYDNQEQQQN